MKKGLLIGGAAALLLVIMAGGWWISTHNSIVAGNEAVRSGWSQVKNQYQRRYDLIPNLVETVKGFAKQEREVLENVTKARASVGQMTVTQETIDDPESFARFQQAQGGLTEALSRLLVVAENYPQLKSDQNFLALQSQLEGTENRIAVERRRFNEAVQEFNVMIKRFPASVIASFGGFSEARYFESEEGAEKAPEVKF